MTEGRDVPGDDQAPLPPGGADAPPPPSDPVPAPVERPVVDWNAGVAWEHNFGESHAARAPAPVTLQVGSIFWRTLDMFVRRPLPFIVLGIPGAVVAALAYGLSSGSRDPGPVLLGALVSFAVGVVFSLAMILAADDVRAGRPLSFPGLIRRALGRTIPVVLSALAIFVAYLGIVIVLALGAGVLSLAGPLGLVIAAVAFIGFIVGFAVVVLRWILAQVAIALDNAGPLEGLRRSWAVTRGNAWRLFGLFLLFGLLVLPLSVGVGALSFAQDGDPVAIVFTALAGIIVTPIFTIAIATTYGDLTGRAAAEPRAGSMEIGRGILIAGLLVCGAVAIVIGVPKVGPRLAELPLAQVPAADRGRILAGTVRNPLDPCKPGGVQGSFSREESIYLGGYFTKVVPAGQTATVYFYIDEALANSAAIGDPRQLVGCYYEADALTGVPAGSYRIVVIYGVETIAEGRFTVR